MSISPPSSPEGSMEMPPHYVQIPTSSDSSDTNIGSSDTNIGSSPLSSFTSQSPMESPIHSSTSTSTFESSSDFTSQSSLMIGRIRRRDAEWMASNMIDEDDYDHEGNYPRSSYHHLIPILGFISVVSIFCLVLWGISRSIKTHIVVKDFRLHKFEMGIGSDHTGVQTTLLTLNTSVKVSIYNPATFFGVHVTAHPLLLYSGIPVAATNVRYYQPRKSSRLIRVNVDGSNIPLYGAARSFNRAANSGRIPLTLEVHIQSLGKVVWTLVEAQHQWNISCPLSIGTSSHQKAIRFSQNSCEYR